MMPSFRQLVGRLKVPDRSFMDATATMHQANEHRLTSIEGWLRLNFLAVMFGGVLMAIQLMGLRDQIIRQNGRVTKSEGDIYQNKADLRIVKWVGATIVSVVVPVAIWVIISAIDGS